MDPLKTRLSLALDLVGDASFIILDFAEKGFAVETKVDGSFVTKADKETERILRENILDHFPEDGLIGEEWGKQNDEAEWVWTIDPIDGTSSFINGVPLYGCMIGLLNNGKSVGGVVHFPSLNETVYAGLGMGTHHRRSNTSEFIPCKIKTAESLKKSMFSYSAPEYFSISKNDELLELLRNTCSKERMWGDCYGHILVATGRLDLMVDPYLHIWDLAPLKIIMEEAGGVHQGLDGNNSISMTSGVSTSRTLMNELLSLLN
ncbi:MAG: histidinol-phosphatase [Halobacteriovorax sp.]|nr:histidinol-phosphatase [Halobacteriovorax sp.]|tara:strand:- start:43166 stop:43948 length:783 start_codon:yes stop_codon:yes gene_type:complete